jgi:hypothetical protein
MAKHPHVKFYQSPRFIIIVNFIVATLAGALASASWSHSDKNWVNISLTIFFFFSLVASYSVIRTRVTISDTSLEVTKGFGTKKYARKTIEDLAIAKGCPALLLLKDGTTVDLPDLNISPLGLRNVVKAWLRSQGKEIEQDATSDSDQPPF